MADAWYLKVPEYTSNTTIEISGVLGAFTVAYELALDIPPYPEGGGNSRYLFDVRRGSGGSSRGWFLQKRDGDVQTTEISNVRINDIAASTSDIFSALKDDICQYTYNRTDDTNGIFAFGSRTNAIEALSGLAVKNIVITDANGVNTIDMSSSGGTGTTLTSDTGNITLTLVGYPAGNSQWELYDDGTGTADTTITGAFSFLPFEFSGNASATLPQPISNSAFDLPELTIAGAQSASLPQPELTGAFSFNALDFSGTQSSSLPQPITNASFELPEFSVSGDISASLPDNTVTSTCAFSFAPFEFSGAQSSTQPQPTSDAAFDLPILTLLATQSASLPQPTVSGAFTLPALTINGSMSLGIPQPIVNGSFELPGFTFSGSGSATFPQPTISGSFELPAITVLGSVSLSGVVINVENSGIIILQAGESSIKLDALSNQIFLH